MNHHTTTCTAVLLGLACTFQAGAQCEEDWIDTPGFGFGGSNGAVQAAVRWDPDGDGPEPELLVVGGMFTTIGDAPASNLAAWDGERWSAVGGGVDGGIILDKVSSLFVYEGRLIVGGHFNTAGETSAANIAAWDGEQWDNLDGGVFGTFSEPTVEAIAEYQGDLYVAGFFTQTASGSAEFIARWDGTSWHSVGGGLEFNAVDLAVFDGSLFVAGRFDDAGGVPGTQFLARWNGSNWSSVGGGTNAAVNALHARDDGLYVGGNFSQAGGVAASRIAKWDGTWSEVGGGTNGLVLDVTEFEGEIHIGGSFTVSGGVLTNRVARFDGSGWQSLAGGTDGDVRLLVDVGGSLMASGIFLTVDGKSIRLLAFWDGETWEGLPDRPYRLETGGLAVFDGDLIATGLGDLDGVGERDWTVMRWDGLEWTPLASAMDNAPWDVATYDGDLYTFGWFSEIDGNAASRIASWDGTVWQPLGAGVSGGSIPSALTITPFEGEMVVGGTFSLAGGDPARNIATWDGQHWAAIGEGVEGALNVVNSVLEFQGELFAAGSFTHADGQPAANIARWDGTQWNAMGSGLSGVSLPEGHAMTIFEGDLIVAGAFATVDGVPATNIARWDGTSWSAFGEGIPFHDVISLAVHDGQLFAGGSFVFNDDSNTRFVRWTGTEWESVGGLVDGSVQHLQVFETELVLSGSFDILGERVAHGFGRWSNNPTPWFARDPETIDACLGDTAQFEGRVAGGYEDGALRWHRDGQALSDGPTGWGSVVSGASTETLTIEGVRANDAATYALVSDLGCSQGTSAAADLGVCVPDFDCSGAVNTLDVLAFLNAWADGDELADLNADGAFDTLDVLNFLNAWAEGC